MDKNILNKIEEGQMKNRPEIQIGDTVKLSLKIKEGSKERIQLFEGTVIAMNGTGLNKTITVRKISYGIGVEKIVPIHAPVVSKIEVLKRGNVRKSKLYFLRDRVGKRALKISGLKDVYLTETEEEKVEEAPVVEEVKES